MVNRLCCCFFFNNKPFNVRCTHLLSVSTPFIPDFHSQPSSYSYLYVWDQNRFYFLKLTVTDGSGEVRGLERLMLVLIESNFEELESSFSLC